MKPSPPTCDIFIKIRAWQKPKDTTGKLVKLRKSGYEPPKLASLQTPVSPGIFLVISKIKVQEAVEASSPVFGMREESISFLTILKQT